MARALGVLVAALACAVAAGAGANEPIAPNELGLTAIDCATQYCTSKDSLLLWLSLENSCFSDKQPCRARVLDVIVRPVRERDERLKLELLRRPPSST